ncbi:MAG TPA: hypothetical protein VMQ44_00805 [Candidatus Saccharimonadales bacterium]|nr:hypothetical protein [Candidatus Saccharimonadales bacterium]
MLIKRKAAYGRQFIALINRYEKVFLALLSVVIVVSGTYWYRQYSSINGGTPTVGGTYVEGIVGSKNELEQVAAKLTKAGLLTVNKDGNLDNLLITGWTVNADQTVYDFTLKDGVPIADIQNDLQENIDLLGEATLSTNGQHLIVTLAQANPNLPFLLAEPLFDFGPYKLSSITDQMAVFTRNTKENAQPTYINKIVVHSYPNQSSLEQALSRQKIDGAIVTNQTATPRNYQAHSFDLSRGYVLTFNTNQSPFRVAADRIQLLNNQPGNIKSFTLTVPNEEPYLTLAKTQIADWQALGVTVTMDAKSLDDVNNLLISRSFQAVVTGVNYGFELDPYYIWSSTQIRPPGNNISGIKSTSLDDYLGRIRSSSSLKDRASLVQNLNSLLVQEGAGKVLETEQARLMVSDAVNYVEPYGALTAADHWQNMYLWSIN